MTALVVTLLCLNTVSLACVTWWIGHVAVRLSEVESSLADRLHDNDGKVVSLCVRLSEVESSLAARLDTVEWSLSQAVEIVAAARRFHETRHSHPRRIGDEISAERELDDLVGRLGN
jgi:hypothetical protein